MIYSNKKMRKYLNEAKTSLSECQLDWSFVQLGGGYFFDREINSNTRSVIDAYIKDESGDWAGLEYGVNKVHLADEIDLPIDDVTGIGVLLVRKLSSNFQRKFPDQKAIFWLSCDAESEFPSVVIGFYIKRSGALALLPEDNQLLDEFNEAILVIS